MKERPILFSGPMVRAILDGRKTQTRRVIKSRYKDSFGWGAAKPLILGSQEDFDARYRCPYGKRGDKLWVREACYVESTGTANGYGRHILYRATDQDAPVSKWTPSIHMPRWASRITLEVESVRVERLQDISAKDAIAEGCCDPTSSTPKRAFEWLWESINGPGSWEANPWVWVVEFRKL